MSATGGAGLRFDPETPPESLLLQELRDDTKAMRKMVETQEDANNKLLQALVQEMRAMETRQLGFPSGLLTNDRSTPIGAALSTERVQLQSSPPQPALTDLAQRGVLTSLTETPSLSQQPLVVVPTSASMPTLTKPVAGVAQLAGCVAPASPAAKHVFHQRKTKLHVFGLRVDEIKQKSEANGKPFTEQHPLPLARCPLDVYEQSLKRGVNNAPPVLNTKDARAGYAAHSPTIRATLFHRQHIVDAIKRRLPANPTRADIHEACLQVTRLHSESAQGGESVNLQKLAIIANQERKDIQLYIEWKFGAGPDPAGMDCEQYKQAGKESHFAKKNELTSRWTEACRVLLCDPSQDAAPLDPSPFSAWEWKEHMCKEKRSSEACDEQSEQPKKKARSSK
jgi:hypothetical protein